MLIDNKISEQSLDMAMEGITFFKEENLMNKSKKIISFIAALAMVVSMLIPNASPVLAAELSDQTCSVVATESLGSISVSTYSSYESSGWFENTYKAPERSYDGNNIGITISAITAYQLTLIQLLR